MDGWNVDIKLIYVEVIEGNCFPMALQINKTFSPCGACDSGDIWTQTQHVVESTGVLNNNHQTYFLNFFSLEQTDTQALLLQYSST